MSLVLMRISIPGIRDRLLLPDNARIVGAGTVQYCMDPVSDAAVLVLTVDMPDAPEGAAAVEPVYQHTGHRDPVEFERFIWRAADGTEIEPAPEPSAP